MFIPILLDALALLLLAFACYSLLPLAWRARLLPGKAPVPTQAQEQASAQQPAMPGPNLHTSLQESTSGVERLLQRAAKFLQEKRYEDACKTYENVLSLDRSNIAAYVGLGETLFKLRQLARAVDVYNRALQIAPENPELYARKIRLLLRLRQNEEALRASEALANLFSNTSMPD